MACLSRKVVLFFSLAAFSVRSCFHRLPGCMRRVNQDASATRAATGRTNAMQLEVYGSAGGLRFDFERMNELLFYDRAQDASESTARPSTTGGNTTMFTADQP